jgi:hypothetical protein
LRDQLCPWRVTLHKSTNARTGGNDVHEQGTMQRSRMLGVQEVTKQRHSRSVHYPIGMADAKGMLNT